MVPIGPVICPTCGAEVAAGRFTCPSCKRVVPSAGAAAPAPPPAPAVPSPDPTEWDQVPRRRASLRRWVGAPVAIAAVAAWAVLNQHDPPAPISSYAGKCVTFSDTQRGHRDISRTVSCSSPHDGVVLAVVGSIDQCPAGTTTTFARPGSGSHLCVQEAPR